MAMDVLEKTFILLELHLLKIIMIALMLLCVTDVLYTFGERNAITDNMIMSGIWVCAMHIPIMIIISSGLLLHQRHQRLYVLLTAVLISMYIMARMVYQIDYFKHSLFDVHCTADDYNSTVTHNRAQWVGFVKATSHKPLAMFVNCYFGVLAVITVYFLVYYRQQRKRQRGLLPPDNQEIFPNVTRIQADKDLKHCIMFLFNYGFHKFGVEITLICLMGVIASRMDVYAVLYAVWLLLLSSVRRQTLCKIWGGFTAFVAFIVPMQYIIAVGFLPMYCMYPWTSSSEQLKHPHAWLFQSYYSEEPNAMKLVFDYLLLVFATLQLRVFRIEQADRVCVGGSNDEDTRDWEIQEFVNPVPDFLGTAGSRLDILKRVIFLGMPWLTLAIVFMTGTYRINLFSMGYLIGSFIFLWQGTDLFLLPKHSILQWWSWLQLYNVSVVVVKMLLQIPGCIYPNVMQEHACWLVQILGIGCVNQFSDGNIARIHKMDNNLQNSTCLVPQENISLAWDGVCFAFLLLQRRIFHSYYFHRVIDEIKAITTLEPRAAELVEELHQKQMQLPIQKSKVFQTIKAEIKRIKMNQKKTKGALHAVDLCQHVCEKERFVKLKGILKTISIHLESIVVSLTQHLMKCSRDYRYVSNFLSVEKKLIKKRPGFGIGVREGTQMRWAPLPGALHSNFNKHTPMQEDHTDSLLPEHSSLRNLCVALGYAALAHTKTVCYLMAFFNSILQFPTLLSVPLPLMVYLWGMTSFPRPSKTFWVTMIAYIQVIVLVKTVFQFDILPFTPPRIIGIQRKYHYALCDLLLLLTILFHRFKLQSFGLWKNTVLKEPEKEEDKEYFNVYEPF